ncbi:MAG: DDE-type integrase/transposase/recombinase [Planctomycetota bacterium]|nr:DDE-type integrase/transposase/recombinase [Planctomycetota bacterium]
MGSIHCGDGPRELGAACDKYQYENVRNLKTRRVQCDEIWSFCYAKDKNVPDGLKGQRGFGDVWTWTAIDADSKLLITWLVGNRDANDAHGFMQDVKDRLANKVQLTTDGHKSYLDAVESAFVGDADYAMLVKVYGEALAGKQSEFATAPRRSFPAMRKSSRAIQTPKHISTSFSERHNLTIRMTNRRFTRLTNAHSKKIENHEHAIALNFMHYNFCKIHSSLRVTPAMQAGLTDHVWEIEELVNLID